MTPRVLVTGSRTWADATAIRQALAEVWGDGTAGLVSGACPLDADRLAEQLWSSGAARWSGTPLTGPGTAEQPGSAQRRDGGCRHPHPTPHSLTTSTDSYGTNRRD